MHYKHLEPFCRISKKDGKKDLLGLLVKCSICLTGLLASFPSSSSILTLRTYSKCLSRTYMHIICINMVCLQVFLECLLQNAVQRRGAEPDQIRTVFTTDWSVSAAEGGLGLPDPGRVWDPEPARGSGSAPEGAPGTEEEKWRKAPEARVEKINNLRVLSKNLTETLLLMLWGRHCCVKKKKKKNRKKMYCIVFHGSDFITTWKLCLETFGNILWYKVHNWLAWEFLSHVRNPPPPPSNTSIGMILITCWPHSIILFITVEFCSLRDLIKMLLLQCLQLLVIPISYLDNTTFVWFKNFHHFSPLPDTGKQIKQNFISFLIRSPIKS